MCSAVLVQYLGSIKYSIKCMCMYLYIQWFRAIFHTCASKLPVVTLVYHDTIATECRGEMGLAIVRA